MYYRLDSISEIVSKLKKDASTIKDDKIKQRFLNDIENIPTDQSKYVIRDYAHDIEIKGDATKEEIDQAIEKCYIEEVAAYYPKDSQTYISVIKEFKNGTSSAYFKLYYTTQQNTQKIPGNENTVLIMKPGEDNRPKVENPVLITKPGEENKFEPTLLKNDYIEDADGYILGVTNCKTISLYGDKYSAGLNIHNTSVYQDVNHFKKPEGKAWEDTDIDYTINSAGFKDDRSHIEIRDRTQTVEIQNNVKTIKKHYITTSIRHGITDSITDEKKIKNDDSPEFKTSTETITLKDNNKVEYTKVNEITQESTIHKTGSIETGQQISMDMKHNLAKVELADIKKTSQYNV